MNIFQKIIAFFRRLFGIKDKPPPAPPYMGWMFQFSPGLGAIGDSFTFPATDGAHYLVKPYSGPLRNGLYLRARIDAAPGTVFSAGTGTGASGGVPHVTLYFQKRGDNLQGPFGRWWSGPTHALLQDGELTIDASLDPANWSSVFGQNGAASLAQFQADSADVQAIGMTFGGTFFGHGVFVPQGSATFTILEWRAS